MAASAGGCFLPNENITFGGVVTFDQNVTITGDLSVTGTIADTGSSFASPTITGTVAGAASYTSPTLVTPVLGVATATSINKVAITAPAASATLTIANTKTLTVSNTLTLAGTDATVMTFPATSATIARTDAANTFTGVQTMTSAALITPDIGAAVGTSVNLSGNCRAASFNVGATAGASGGPFTGLTGITVVNGIVTAITGT